MAVEVRHDGGLITVEFARPDCANLITVEMLEALGRAFELIRDRDPEVVVFRAQGEHFSLGRDHHDGEGPAAVLPLLRMVTESVQLIPAVTIAAVRGRAFGLAAGLVALADVAIASDTAELAFDEVAKGIVPTFVLSYLGRHVSPKLAYELVATCRVLSAAEAQSAGLVTTVVPGERLDEAVSGVVGSLLMKDRAVLRGVKEYIRSIETVPFAERPQHALDRGLEYFAGH